MARAQRSFDGSFYLGSHRVPTVLAVLIGLTLAITILGAVGHRNGFPLFAWTMLVPALAVQVWRLVTWVFIQPEALSLIFACLGLWWFGRDLLSIWGPRRFLAVFFGIAAGAGALTCALAAAVPQLRGVPFYGTWGILDALIIAWATAFPGRDLLLYFVLPLRGRTLVYATIGGTVLLALLNGVTAYIPYFFAEALMLAWLRLPQLRARMATGFAKTRRPTHLRSVDRWPTGRDDDKPRWYH
jgi:membrane associated rhomboid family serine protease